VSTKAKNAIPFSLGFEGEEWNYELGALAVPIGKDWHVLVVSNEGGRWNFNLNDDHYYVINSDKWQGFESLLMLSCVVEELIASFKENNQ